MKKIIIWQIIGSILVLSIMFFGKNINNTAINNGYTYVMSVLMNNVTMEDVRDTYEKCLTVFKESPAKIVSAVAKANNESIYAKPIDEKSSDFIKQVHSVAGGKVTMVGNNKELGLYISIKHEKAVSTYGHLSEIGVVPMERIQRGEIIGSYDSKCGEEFYYHLDDKL